MTEEKSEIKKPKEVKDPKVSEETKSQLPDPSGWKILVAMPQAEEKTEGGILKATQTIKDEEVTNICGYVLKMGPDCYKDEVRFPNGPWCKVNDWIIFGRYAGSRFGIEGGEVRILNEDEIIAVVKDPEDILQFKT